MRTCAADHVDGGITGADAEVTGLDDGLEERTGLEELLGGDASDVQTGATDLVLLDHGDVQAGGRAVQGRGIAAGATTDDDDVVAVRRDHLLHRTWLDPVEPTQARVVEEPDAVWF